jgi:hypothetical protein
MPMMGRFTLVCLGFAVVSGCGSVGPANSPDGGGGGSFTLNATPTSLNIPIASTGTVTIAINRTGSVGDVMLSAQNLPSGITAMFAANPVPAASSSTDVTFSVAPGTPPGSSNVTIVGSANGSQQTATVTVNAQTITVTGTIRNGAQGITVRLVGKPSVMSGVGGAFTFTDVSPPYDIYTVGTTGFGTLTTPTVFYFQGLTRPDPVVSAPQSFLIALPLGSTGTIAGSKSGNTDVTNPMMIIWDSGGTQTVAPSSYSFTASWPKAATRAGTLYGFQFSKKATGAPDVFTGYASSGQVTISENTTNTVNLTMSAPATAALTGSITAPAGFPNPTITLTQQIGASNSLVLWTATTTAAAATIPLVSAGKAAMFATATLNNATISFVHPALAAATDITFALPAPSTQNAPLDQAVGVTATTQFTWTPAQNTVYEVTFATTTTQGSAKARYQLYTTSSNVKPPVVPELALPSNQSFTWAVNGYGPNTSINDAASATGLESVSSADFDGARHWFTNSTDRAFTTSP